MGSVFSSKLENQSSDTTKQNSSNVVSSSNTKNESLEQLPETTNLLQESASKYHSVRIQNLEKLPEQPSYSNYETKPVDMWKGVKCKHYYHADSCKCQILCYEENIESTCSGHSNNFFSAFLRAYNKHEDVVLSPVDTWLMVCFIFSKYVNDNAEQMRKLFVSHEGKKMLTVTTENELEESQWDEFFTLMMKEVKANTKNNICDMLSSNFSVTTRVENILSVMTVMDSFKKYFDYGRCIPCCGINNVHFEGTLNDWNMLLTKTKKLKEYDVNGNLNKYIDNLLPVLHKFIETYNGNVDVDWWNKIMNITHGRIGSGSTSYVSGWILKFLNHQDKVDIGDISNYNIDVPVKLDNRLTGVKKMVNLVGGFSGVNKSVINGNNAYRPQMSMIVFWDGVELKE